MNLAQTNLQLYLQMAKAGYLDDDLGRANEAYFLAAECTSRLFRGSGKPFISHLVGTASALVYEQRSIDVITAALLHAVYQDRVPFAGGASLDARRRVIRARFGDACEELVDGYHEFEFERLDQYGGLALQERSEVVFIRLADELEDLYDYGLLMHGKDGEDASVRGTADWRLIQKARILPELLRAAHAVGADSLANAIHYWAERSRSVCWPAGLRSERYTSYELE